MQTQVSCRLLKVFGQAAQTISVHGMFKRLVRVEVHRRLLRDKLVN